MNTPHDEIMDALEVITVMLALILVEVCRIAGDPLTAVIFGSLSVAYVLSWHVKRRIQRKTQQEEVTWPD